MFIDTASRTSHSTDLQMMMMMIMLVIIVIIIIITAVKACEGMDV
jgi:hypothetical protein